MEFHNGNDLHHIVSLPIVSLVLPKLASLKANLYTFGCTKRPDMGKFSIISAHIVKRRGQLSARLAYRSTEGSSVLGKTC